MPKCCGAPPYDCNCPIFYGYIDESYTLNLVEYKDWVLYVDGDKCPSHLWTSKLYSAATREEAYEELERQARARSELDFVSGREKEYRRSNR